MELVNSAKISGKVVKIYQLQQTLSGLPVFSFLLEHVSNQIEAGNSRVAKCQVYCIVVNNKDILAQNLLDCSVVVSGFLSQNSKQQLVLNVQNVIAD